jgi:hypothetical protein
VQAASCLHRPHREGDQPVVGNQALQLRELLFMTDEARQLRWQVVPRLCCPSRLDFGFRDRQREAVPFAGYRDDRVDAEDLAQRRHLHM